MSTNGDGGRSGAVVSYDYDIDDKSSVSHKPPMFNGDPVIFYWWKSKLYSHIIGIDEDFWDILEDGVDLTLDEEDVAIDRKKHTTSQKKLYKKHHKIRGILVAALPHKEYLKMSDKYTAKYMFKSLCSNYEGNKKVQEAKLTMLVQQYEMFIIKENEYIEAMYSRFYTLVSRLQIMKKSYVVSQHVKKILRSLPAEARDLSTLSLEDFIISLKCHEIGLNEEEPVMKSKSIALKPKGKSSKALKANEFEDESPVGGYEEDSEAEEMIMLSKRLQYLAKKNKRFLNISSGYKGSSSKKENQKGCFNCKKPGHFIVDCLDLQKNNLKKTNFKSSNFRKRIKKSMMATWDDLDNESESKKDEAKEEANLALVATTASYAESETNSEDENELYSNLTRSELIDFVKELLSHYQTRSKELKSVTS